MKKTQIYEGTVIAVTEDLHEGSGVLKGTYKKPVKGCFRMPISAANETAAKHQLIQAALLVDPELDLDTAEITCSPFCG